MFSRRQNFFLTSFILSKMTEVPNGLNLSAKTIGVQNQFQVTNQIAQEGSYKNRYDVTILINGLPFSPD